MNLVKEHKPPASIRSGNTIFFALVVSLGGFLFGFDASVISGVVNFIVPLFELNDWEQGMAVSAPTLFAIIGMIISGPLSDQVGRKSILIYVAFFYTFSAIGSALATTFWMLVIARGIGGLAFGAALILAPMYIAEVSPPGKRGQMVSINQLNIVLGFSAAYFCNYFILNASDSDVQWIQALDLSKNAWRWMLGIETVPALMFWGMLFLIPRSPRWLIMKGRINEARQVIAKTAGENFVEQEIAEVRESIEESTTNSGSRFKDLFHPSLRLVIAIGLIVGIAQQITGVNAIYFYAPTIFEASGIGTNAAFAQAIWVGIVNVIFTLIAMVFIDRIGRKPLLIVGLTGVAISMSIAALGFYNATYQLDKEAMVQLPLELRNNGIEALEDKVFNSDLEFKKAIINVIGQQKYKIHTAELLKLAANLNPTLILLGILGFVASFAISLGPVMWVLFSELFPNWIRGVAISAVGFVNSSVSFLVQFMFPWELSNLGNTLTFLSYALFAVIGLLLVLKLLPETKGKTLEELEKVLIKK